MLRAIAKSWLSREPSGDSRRPPVPPLRQRANTTRPERDADLATVGAVRDLLDQQLHDAFLLPGEERGPGMLGQLDTARRNLFSLSTWMLNSG